MPRVLQSMVADACSLLGEAIFHPLRTFKGSMLTWLAGGVGYLKVL